MHFFERLRNLLLGERPCFSFTPTLTILLTPGVSGFSPHQAILLWPQMSYSRGFPNLQNLMPDDLR